MTSVLRNIPQTIFTQANILPVSQASYKLLHLATLLRFYGWIAPMTILKTVIQFQARQKSEPAAKWGVMRVIRVALARAYSTTTYKWSLQPPATISQRRCAPATHLGGDLKAHHISVKKASDEYYTGECARARRYIHPAMSVPCFWIYPQHTPFDLSRIHEEKVILFLHGGGYISEHPLSLPAGAYGVRETGHKCLAVNYRLSDGINGHPAPLQDCVTAYVYLTQTLGVRGENVAVVGDSAGGNAANALIFHLLQLKQEGTAITLPRFVSLISPWSDMTATFPSIAGNRECDVLPPFSSQSELVRSHLKWTPESIANKYNSPALQEHVAFRGWQEHTLKVHIQVGQAEILRDEGVALAQLLRDAGVETLFTMIEGEVHDAVNINPHAELAKRDFLMGLQWGGF
ncbi:hypothetical protein E3P77_00247 [Wallemia ichthyophaga]|nr:hypothetical protein E3P77_00247 [Wallemia ichthyophaga]